MHAETFAFRLFYLLPFSFFIDSFEWRLERAFWIFETLCIGKMVGTKIRSIIGYFKRKDRRHAAMHFFKCFVINFPPLSLDFDLGFTFTQVEHDTVCLLVFIINSSGAQLKRWIILNFFLIVKFPFFLQKSLPSWKRKGTIRLLKPVQSTMGKSSLIFCSERPYK